MADISIGTSTSTAESSFEQTLIEVWRQAVVVFAAVLVGQIAPLAVDMAREELARLLSCFLKRGQSARCRDDLAEFESRLFAELLHWKNSFCWFGFLLLRGDAQSGA